VLVFSRAKGLIGQPRPAGAAGEVVAGRA